MVHQRLDGPRVRTPAVSLPEYEMARSVTIDWKFYNSRVINDISRFSTYSMFVRSCLVDCFDSVVRLG